MTHSQTNTHKHYQQLSFSDRATIQALQAAGDTATVIAQKLHRSKATISREITRGSVTQLDSKRHSHQVYLAETAQAMHDRKRDRTGHYAFLKTGRAFFKALARELTRKPRVHSVDSFVHFYRDQGKACPSTTTVYRYIDAGLLELDNMTLPKKLRRRIKGYKNAHKRKLRSSSRFLTIMRTPALKPCRTRSTTTGPRNLRVSLLTMVPSLPSYQRLLEPRFTSHIRTRLGRVAQTRTPMDCLGNSSRKGSLSEQLPWLKFKQSNPH